MTTEYNFISSFIVWISDNWAMDYDRKYVLMATYIIGLYVLFDLNNIKMKASQSQLQDEQTIIICIFLYDKTPQKYVFWVRNSIMKSIIILMILFLGILLWHVVFYPEVGRILCTICYIDESFHINCYISWWFNTVLNNFPKKIRTIEEVQYFFCLLDFKFHQALTLVEFKNVLNFI